MKKGLFRHMRPLAPAVLLIICFAVCSSFAREDAVASIGNIYLDIISTEIRDYGHARILGGRLADHCHFQEVPDCGYRRYTRVAHIAGLITAVQISLKTRSVEFRKEDFYIGSIHFPDPENARVVIRNRKSDSWRSVISLRQMEGNWKIHDIA